MPEAGQQKGLISYKAGRLSFNTIAFLALQFSNYLLDSNKG